MPPRGGDKSSEDSKLWPQGRGPGRPLRRRGAHAPERGWPYRPLIESKGLLRSCYCRGPLCRSSLASPGQRRQTLGSRFRAGGPTSGAHRRRPANSTTGRNRRARSTPFGCGHGSTKRALDSTRHGGDSPCDRPCWAIRSSAGWRLCL